MKILVITAMALLPLNAQDMPKNLIPDSNPYFCEARLTDGQGKEYVAVVKVSKPYEGITTIESGRRHPYPFKTAEEAFPHNIDPVTMNVNGEVFGDDAVDNVFYQNSNKFVGWDAKTKRTQISPQEIDYFNKVIELLRKCVK